MINIRIALLRSTLLHTVHIRRLSLVIKHKTDQSQNKTSKTVLTYGNLTKVDLGSYNHVFWAHRRVLVPRFRVANQIILDSIKKR